MRTMVPFFSRLEKSTKILVAGCGGGFDVFAGVPIAQYLAAMGKSVVFANFSFSNLWLCGGERVTSTMWRVDRASNEMPYFPEKWLAEWLHANGQTAPVYAFAKSGVRPLRAAYSWLMEHHQIDLIVLIDGGTDSVIFGDEPGLGLGVGHFTWDNKAAAAAVSASCLLVPSAVASPSFGTETRIVNFGA